MRQLGLENVLAFSLVLAVTACSSPEEMSADLGTESGDPTASNTAPSMEQIADAVAADATPMAFEDNAEQDGGSRDFAYGWPRQVSAIEQLATLLDAERQQALDHQKGHWQQSLTDFGDEDCVACKTLAYSKEWKVVANIDRFLSLSGDIYEYGGGAHGNYWFDALVWDRTANAALNPREMFTSNEALWQALEQPYCAALDEERAKRRDGFDTGGFFAACPGLEELTLLVGSSDGERFDRLGLLAAPYVAGPYAEGAYEVTLPISEEALAAVKPDYQAAFRAR